MHIHKKKQDTWLKNRESKNEELRDVEDKEKFQETKDINEIMEKMYQYWDEE